MYIFICVYIYMCKYIYILYIYYIYIFFKAIYKIPLYKRHGENIHGGTWFYTFEIGVSKVWTPKNCLVVYVHLIAVVPFCLVFFEIWDKPNQPCQFRSVMCGGHAGDSIAHFWKHLKTLSGYKYHDVLHNLSEEELTKAIPFAIHGDGAEFHRHSEYFVMSWTTALQTGSGNDNLLSRFPISLVAEAHMGDEEDLWLLMKFVLMCLHHTQSYTGFWFPLGSNPKKRSQIWVALAIMANGACLIERWFPYRLTCQSKICANFSWKLWDCGWCCSHGPTQGQTRSQQDPGGCGGMESWLGRSRHLPQPWFLWRKVWQQHVQVYPVWKTDCRWLQAPWKNPFSYNFCLGWNPTLNHLSCVIGHLGQLKVGVHDFQGRLESPDAVP